MQAIKPSFAKSFAQHIALGVAITALLVSKWCCASKTVTQQPTKKCSIIYINGDAVITCKKAQ